MFRRLTLLVCCALMTNLFFAKNMKHKTAMKTKDNGDLETGIKSVAFENRWVRSDGSLVNVQYQTEINDFEKWKFVPQDSGANCILSVRFTRYLSLNADYCSGYNDNGCGVVNMVDECGENETFNLVQVNNAYGIQSTKNPNAFLRLDGTDINEFTGSGGGKVNGQYYEDGTSPAGWELFYIDRE